MKLLLTIHLFCIVSNIFIGFLKIETGFWYVEIILAVTNKLLHICMYVLTLFLSSPWSRKAMNGNEWLQDQLLINGLIIAKWEQI